MADSSKDAVIKQKEFLAEEALKVANEAIGLLQDQMSECSTRDLVQIFSASVKAHREITEDIVLLTAKEAPSEQVLRTRSVHHTNSEWYTTSHYDSGARG